MTDPIAALKARFAARCTGDLERLKALIDADDIDTDEARSLAHSLSGAGATFGYPDVSTAAGRLDDAFAEGRRPTDGDMRLLIAALEAMVTPPS